MKQFVVLGRRKAESREETENSEIYRMKIFAPNQVSAKSRFWYYMRQLRKLKVSRSGCGGCCGCCGGGAIRRMGLCAERILVRGSGFERRAADAFPPLRLVRLVCRCRPRRARS